MQLRILLHKSYNLTAEFTIFNAITATYHKEVKNRDKIVKLLPKLVKYEYKLDNCKKSNCTSAAPPPYITSSIQQDASSQIWNVSNTDHECIAKII